MGGNHDWNLYFVSIEYRTKGECKSWSTTLRAKNEREAISWAKAELKAQDKPVRYDRIIVR